MHTRDASGRRVSLLNDEIPPETHYQLSYRPGPPVSYYHSSSRSISSSPHTPDLLRSDSYDSQTSNELASPLTPIYDYGRSYGPVSVATDPRSPYNDYMEPPHVYAGTKRPGSFSDDQSVSHEEDAVTSPGGSEKPGRRYPCRFRDSHGCEKTFTTSGHASRHSKIHTAEKAVPCSFPGCTKKFTRADNMKQHLDTHYKEKSRSSTSRHSMSSSERRLSTSGKSSSGRSKLAAAPAARGDAWDMKGLDLPSLGRPSAARTLSGLDTLARIACQERS